jgi:glycerol-3-phosphate dehydrogenase
MSTGPSLDVEVAVLGAGVVGCATALALARRGVSTALLEAEAAPALGASGTNSGILHNGFDSPPGELETELILRSASLREGVLAALDIPVLRCGAVVNPRGATQLGAVAGLARTARRNGLRVVERSDGSLEIPSEAVTDPVRYTLALAQAARRHGAELHLAWRVAGIERAPQSLCLHAAESGSIRCRVAVNSAGLQADTIARLIGDESFEIYPRKGEFLVFDPPAGEPLERIILPVPTKRTKGVLVFPTLDGRVIAGPTAVDQQDKQDWSVRPQARDEILPAAYAIYPPLEGAEPIAAYAGLRPAGRDANYLIGVSPASPRLVNVAAIRSTGLSASLGIAERVVEIIGTLGVALRSEDELRAGPRPEIDGPWWRRTAEYRSAA